MTTVSRTATSQQPQTAPVSETPSPEQRAQAARTAREKLSQLLKGVTDPASPMAFDTLWKDSREVKDLMMQAVPPGPSREREKKAGDGVRNTLAQLVRAREAMDRKDYELAKAYLDAPAQSYADAYEGAKSYRNQAAASSVLRPADLQALDASIQQLRAQVAERQRNGDSFTTSGVGATPGTPDLQSARQAAANLLERVERNHLNIDKADITQRCQEVVNRLLAAGVSPEKALAVNNAIGDYWRAKNGTSFPSETAGNVEQDLALFRQNAAAAGDLLPSGTLEGKTQELQAARAEYVEKKAELLKAADRAEQMGRVHKRALDTAFWASGNSIAANKVRNEVVPAAEKIGPARASGNDRVLYNAVENMRAKEAELEKAFPNLYGQMAQDRNWERQVMEVARDACKVSLKVLGNVSGRPALGAVLAGAIDLAGDLASAKSWNQALQKTLINFFATAVDAAVSQRGDFGGNLKKELMALIGNEVAGATADYAKNLSDIQARTDIGPEKKAELTAGEFRKLIGNVVGRVSVALGARYGASDMAMEAIKSTFTEVAKYVGYEKMLKQ